MGNIFQCVKILVMRWYFDTAFPSGRTVEIQRTRVIKYAAIGGQVIIMESLVHRAGGGAGEKSVGAFGKPGAALAAEAKTYPHTIGLCSLDTESRIPLGVYLRILLA